MIAISLLFVRMLCDCFKSRRQLEAEILAWLTMQSGTNQSPHPNSLITVSFRSASRRSRFTVPSQLPQNWMTGHAMLA